MTIRPQVLLGVLTLALGLALPFPAHGQCTLLPDGLDGPCCETTDIQIPPLPDVTIRTKYICWDTCDPRLSGPVRTEFRPQEVTCGYYRNRVTITNVGGGLTAWVGTLIMTYSRTFAESSNGIDPDTQVWRFLLNGDLRPGADLVAQFGNNTCVVAPCFFAYSRIHVKGYIDYARDCATGEFSVAFAFDHDCDVFEHDDAFSCRPGSFHPLRSYTWVGPEAAFVCDPDISTTEGVLRQEAFRNYDFSQPLADICQNEQPLNVGSLVNEGEFCSCFLPGGTRQYKLQLFSAGTVCGSSAFFSPTGPWLGLLGKSIGFWTDPTTFPGNETLHLQSLFASYTDGCTQEETRPHFYGAQTRGGFPTFQIVGIPGGPVDTMPTANRMIDLANSTLPAAGGAAVIGKRSVADKIIAVNIAPQ